MVSRVPGSTMATQALRSAMASWVPGSAMATWAPRSAMAARAPRSAMAPGTGAALEASCPVLSPCPLRPPERPPPPLFDVIRRGTRLLEGGGNVRLSLSVSCVSPPLVPIFGQFLFLSSFVIISSQPCVFSWLVPSPVLLIILFAPSFPSLYKSSVFPVSLSSINVILVCTCSPAISIFPNKVFKRTSTSPRSWIPPYIRDIIRVVG